MKKYTVEVTVPAAGTAVDSDIFEAAGYPSDYSGCCLASGDRDHGWENLSETEAKDMKARLNAGLVKLNGLNGRDLGGTVTVI